MQSGTIRCLKKVINSRGRIIATKTEIIRIIPFRKLIKLFLLLITEGGGYCEIPNVGFICDS